jgi:hypothetical protein
MRKLIICLALLAAVVGGTSGCRHSSSNSSCPTCGK